MTADEIRTRNLFMGPKRISLIKQRMMRYAKKHGWDENGLQWLRDMLNAVKWEEGVSEWQHLFVAADLRRELWKAVYATIGK